ncbi:MAG TPA: hypothetical protein VHE81_19910 [Lacipirellulaceae bacterium]|nr:hypothetical protein [Lacipirellulaceae bacterium]
MPISRAECMQAFGYEKLSQVPAAQITFPSGPSCREACKGRAANAPKELKNYAVFDNPVADDNYPLRRFAAAIRLADYPDYGAFCQYVKKFSNGERIRLVKRAQKNGYFVELCDLRTFSVDRMDIHQSKETRQGQPIRGVCVLPIEELGGVPTRYLEPKTPECENYWIVSFGVFLPETGHKQGDVTVDKRMVAYINLNRVGEYAFYGTILGHGAHLANGVMDLCHHHIVEMLLEKRAAWAANLRYIWYAGMEDGTPGLYQWKRRSGFKPHRFYARQRVSECAMAATRE